MGRAAILALGFWIAAADVTAQTAIMPGAPTVSPEVAAAYAKVRDGNRSELMRLAEGGRADAQTYAGLLLAFGSGSADEQRRGCGWLEAASASRSDAMHTLGEAFEHGRCGGKPDIDRAIATYRKAGNMGMAKSRCAEGNLLITQKREIPRAVALCRQGAESGDPDAQTDLANIYLQGNLVPRDMTEARRWYEKVAAQNQANAAHVLGQIYWNGDGVPKDNARAAQLWRISFAGGREDSAFYLGDEAFVRAGQGPGKWIVEDLEEARDWYAKAVDARNPEIARQARERLTLMTQLAGAMRRQRGR